MSSIFKDFIILKTNSVDDQFTLFYLNTVTQYRCTQRLTKNSKFLLDLVNATILNTLQQLRRESAYIERDLLDL